MKIMNIWFALVEIKPIGNNTILNSAYGAFVNVAYKALSIEEFEFSVKATFKESDFQVIEIDEIESKMNLEIDNPDNAEKLELLNDIEQEGYDYSWGIYHTFHEEE